MMDSFAEQLVEKEPSSSDTFKKFMLCAVGGIICAATVFAAFFLGFPLILIVTVGVVYLLYILLTGFNVEYEYTITNGSLDIDKIIAKRKRMGLITVEVKDFTAFGSYDEADDSFGGTTVLTMGGEEDTYYADFTDEKLGEVRLVFSPDEKVLECIKPYLPRQLKYQNT